MLIRAANFGIILHIVSCDIRITTDFTIQTKEKEKIEVGKLVFQYADPLFKDAAKIVVENQSASTSLIQRSLGIGYNRASRLLDMLGSAEIVSTPKNGTYFRDVLIEDTRELMYKLLDIKMDLLKQVEKELF